MSRRRRRKRLSRTTKVWLSIAATVLGGGLLTAAALLVDASRDTDLGDETEGVTSRYTAELPDDAPKLVFTDVTDTLGLDFVHGVGPRTRNLIEDMGSGLAWGDYDGDGDPDLYVVDLAATEDQPDRGNRLFRNDGERFTDVTAAAGVGDAAADGMGAWFVDFDGDGDLDLFVTNRGPDRLFRNDGAGTFTDVAGEAGLADEAVAHEWSAGCAWGDYDLDGDLDVHVCAYVDYSDVPPLEENTVGGKGGADGGAAAYTAPSRLNPKSFDPVANHLYRNRGDGTFEDVAVEAGVDDPRGRSLEAVWADLDGDGRLDLYVNNDVSPNALFLGRDDATFGNAGLRSGTADERGSMGLTVGDVIGPASAGGGPDGVPDMLITHWVAQQNALYEGTRPGPGQIVFRDRATRLHLGEMSFDRVGWSSGMADLDLDGRQELVVTNGSTLERSENPLELVAEAPFVLWNDGRVYHDLAPTLADGLGDARVGRGMALADFDGDGDVDLALLPNRGRLRLFRNDTADLGRSLTVRLDAPAALAHGARVTLTTPTGTQTRWAHSDAGYLSQHQPLLPFGLGTLPDDAPVTVEIDWVGAPATTHTVPPGTREVRYGAR